MAIFNNAVTAFKLGPRYWTRAYYRVKATAYEKLRHAPIDQLANRWRGDNGIIIRNQGAWGHFSAAQMQDIQKAAARNKLLFAPGRELFLTVQKGVASETIGRALDYIAANREMIAPFGIPVRVVITAATGTVRSSVSRLVLKQADLLGINRLADLGRQHGVNITALEGLQAAMDAARCVLCDQTDDRNRPTAKPVVYGGYDERVKRDEFTPDDLAAFGFDKYNAKKYSPVVQAIVADAKKSGATVELHWGYPLDLEAALSRQGYRVFNFKMKESFFEAYIAVRDGQYKYALVMADPGRELHCQKMLRRSGVGEDQVIRCQYFRSPADQVRETMELFVGKVPETVIMGNRGSFRRLVKKHRYMVEYLRGLARDLPAALAALKLRVPEAARALEEWSGRYSEMFDLRGSVPVLHSLNELRAQRYCALEKELELMKERYHQPELDGLRTMIGEFREFKQRNALAGTDDYLGVVRRLAAAAERSSDPELRQRYQELARKIQAVFETEKPRLKELLALDPAQLYSDPAHLIALIRLDELVASIDREHRIIPELHNLRVFPFDVEVGEKIPTPIFTCQKVSFRDDQNREKELLLVDVPYGETAYHLANYVIAAGARNILFSGMVGWLKELGLSQEKITALMQSDQLVPPQGEMVVPVLFHNSEGDLSVRSERLNLMAAGGRGHFREVEHIVVDAPYDETPRWLAEQRARQIGTVDVELTWVAQAIERAGPGVNFWSLNVISDLVGVPNLQLTDEHTGEAGGRRSEKEKFVVQRAEIMQRFADLLGIAKVLVNKSSQSQPIIDVHKDTVENYAGLFKIEFAHRNKDRARRLEIIAQLLGRPTNLYDLSKMIVRLERLAHCRITALKVY